MSQEGRVAWHRHHVDDKDYLCNGIQRWWADGQGPGLGLEPLPDPGHCPEMGSPPYPSPEWDLALALTLLQIGSEDNQRLTVERDLLREQLGQITAKEERKGPK